MFAWGKEEGKRKEKMKLCLEGHACHLSTLEEEAGGLALQGHPLLHNEIEASLAFT